MKRLTEPNVLVRVIATGKIGTTCYNHVDGVGIKYGVHTFVDDYPEPDEIFRNFRKELEIVNDFTQQEDA